MPRISNDNDNNNDFSKLQSVEFIFAKHSGKRDFLFNHRFGNTLELKDVQKVFVDNDPAKGLLPDAKLQAAFRRIVVDHLIKPKASKTVETTFIMSLVNIAPIKVRKIKGNNYRGGQLTRLRSRTLAHVLRDATQRKRQGDCNHTIEIYIGTTGWYYPLLHHLS